MARLIPISELPDSAFEYAPDQMEGRIVWNVELPPYLDQDRIVIDHGHLNRLHKIAGSTLTSVSTFDGTQAEYDDIQITGFNIDGTAMRGNARKTQSAEPAQHTLRYEFPDPRIHSAYGTHTDFHRLNKPSMVEDVSNLRQARTMSGEAAWAQVLDAHLQRSIRESARDVLVRREDRPRKSRDYEYMFAVCSAGLIATDISFDIPVYTLFAGIASGILGAEYALGVLTDEKYNRSKLSETLRSKRRWSMFTKSQPDRYVALNALTRINSLVKLRK